MEKMQLEMFYLNTIEQLGQLEVCLPYSRLLTGIPIMAVFQNLRWNSNKTSLCLWFSLRISCKLVWLGRIYPMVNIIPPWSIPSGSLNYLNNIRINSVPEAVFNRRLDFESTWLWLLWCWCVTTIFWVFRISVNWITEVLR